MQIQNVGFTPQFKQMARTNNKQVMKNVTFGGLSGTDFKVVQEIRSNTNNTNEKLDSTNEKLDSLIEQIQKLSSIIEEKLKK